MSVGQVLQLMSSGDGFRPHPMYQTYLPPVCVVPAVRQLVLRPTISYAALQATLLDF